MSKKLAYFILFVFIIVGLIYFFRDRDVDPSKEQEGFADVEVNASIISSFFKNPSVSGLRVYNAKETSTQSVNLILVAINQDRVEVPFDGQDRKYLLVDHQTNLISQIDRQTAEPLARNIGTDVSIPNVVAEFTRLAFREAWGNNQIPEYVTIIPASYVDSLGNPHASAHIRYRLPGNQNDLFIKSEPCPPNCPEPISRLLYDPR